MMAKYGYVIHLVVGDTSSPNNTNYHTHGLPEKCGHADLQICLNIKPELAQDILNGAVELIEEGQKFEAGKEYDRVLGGGYKVKFIEAMESNRPVLRLVIPNPEGKFTGSPYADQLIV
ncbi:MAG TPA: DUF4262 domain-containing protein [Anaerovoracaceae bacterium]|nr:DUF4262 domain-containing protein [Anaerovoracaceae bacterium]